MKKLAYILLLLQFMVGVAYAQQTFVVKDIQIDGLQRVSQQTVENYLPVRRGQTLSPAKTASIVQSLYQTGFFDHISLSRSGNTLVIHVSERPTIGKLSVTGNSIIPTDKLTSVMKSLDVAEGRIYNPAVMEKIKQSLLNQYYSLGRYNARVNVFTAPMPRNRLLVHVNISEGLVAKVKRITIIGNHVFSENTLIKQMDLTTPGLFTFISQSDRYSEDRLNSSVDKIRNYYLDHGYIHVQIKSAEAQVTPDRKAVYVTIVVSEGEQYTVSSVDLTGNNVVPYPELRRLITVKPGDVFSRQKVMDSEKAITNDLGNQGYLFATVDIKPTLNEKNRTIGLVFDVKPGKRTYVRHVTFSNNTRTNDVVLRREILQMEAAPASTQKIEDSKHNLLSLPYIKDVDLSVNPVPENKDQVDVNYKVTENNSAEASFKLGYTQQYGILVGAGFNQKNVFGTGNTLGIDLTRNKYEQFYNISYTNPYYTEDGISRSFNMSVSRINPSATPEVGNGYTLNEYNLGVLYSIPIGQEENVFSYLYGGLSYDNVLVRLDNDRTKVSNQVLDFTQRHGRHFQQADFKFGYSRNSLDRAIFPTRGTLQTAYLDIFAPLDRNSLSYYIFNYSGHWFEPLNDQFILTSRLGFGYGNGFHGTQDFPYFKNFYAGGIDSVRGYLPLTLGPQDSRNNAYGGNMLIDGSVGLIFPNFISDTLRTSAFFDAGNVYATFNNKKYGITPKYAPPGSTNSGPLRYSIGVEADWLTPFGPTIRLSLAKPVFTHKPFKTDAFQFAMGAEF